MNSYSVIIVSYAGTRILTPFADKWTSSLTRVLVAIPKRMFVGTISVVVFCRIMKTRTFCETKLNGNSPLDVQVDTVLKTKTNRHLRFDLRCCEMYPN